jgi:hypothetical protein
MYTPYRIRFHDPQLQSPRWQAETIPLDHATRARLELISVKKICMQWISQKSSWSFRPRLGNRLEAFTKLKFLNGGEKKVASECPVK